MEGQETQEYTNIVRNILDNEEFKKTKLIEHHGITRYDHSVKVSYYSYKVAKFLRLNYIETARGGLLHDFFISPEDRTKKEKFISTFIHPKQALATAKENFTLTRREEDMIRSHMFPINISVPKYAESWIVSTVDKIVAAEELSVKFRIKVKYAYTIAMLFMINLR